MSKLFFTSDTHEDHANIIKYCKRPFKDVEEMNAVIYKAYSSKVEDSDTVYHLGDVIFGSSYGILTPYQGTRHLIAGNHDHEEENIIDHNLYRHFESVSLMKMVKDPASGLRFFLCHYPLEEWPGKHKGVIHLHGHCHGTLQTKMPNRMDVGVDCHPNFEPFSVAEILKHLNHS